MSYKLIAVLVAALLAAPVLADEQRGGKGGQGGPGGKGGDRIARMQEHLQLSDEQVAEMRRIRENGGTRKEMLGVLNDSQRTQLEEHRAMRKGGQGGGKREAPPET
jgi:Spy/CpxP family protein refolding chaperone